MAAKKKTYARKKRKKKRPDATLKDANGTTIGYRRRFKPTRSRGSFGSGRAKI